MELRVDMRECIITMLMKDFTRLRWLAGIFETRIVL